MNKTQFLEYFKKNKLSSSDNTEITVTKVVTSATQIISNAEYLLSKTKSKSEYQKTILKKIKREVGIYANSFGTASVIKKFTSKYSKYSFNRTTANIWENKFKDGANVMFKKAERPNLLVSNLIKK